MLSESNFIRTFEVNVKSALVRSKIPDIPFVINPYTGCSHGCRYCYAVFMCQYSKCSKNLAWGSFVEVKVNLIEILHHELKKKRKVSSVMLSSVCDPYQPIEEKYRITRNIIELLRNYGWSIHILTRSSLVLRDMDLLKTCIDLSIGITITTDNDKIRAIFEPNSPSIQSRIETLKQLHLAGIKTWVFIAPALPMNVDNLLKAISPYANYIEVDSLNYSSRIHNLLKKYNWTYIENPEYTKQISYRLLNFNNRR